MKRQKEWRNLHWIFHLQIRREILGFGNEPCIILDESLRHQIKMKGEADYVTEVDIQISNYLKKSF